MSQHQDAIYANDRIDLILPYGKIDEEFYQQIIAPYEPTVINDQFVVIHIPIRPNELLENIRFVYSLVPNLYVPLDITSLEVSGILRDTKSTRAESSWKKCVTGICGYGNRLYASGFFISRWTDADRGNLGSDSALFHRGRASGMGQILSAETDPRGSKSGKSSFPCAGDRSGRTWNLYSGGSCRK